MTDTNELTLVSQKNEIETGEAEKLEQSFGSFFSKAKELREKAMAIVVTDVDQVGAIAEAKQARSILKQIRIDADKVRKDLKADSTRRGNAIQGMYNIIFAVVKPLEEHLEKQEKFVENEQNRLKAERLSNRIDQLQAVEFDTSFCDVSAMGDEIFENFLKEKTEIFNKKKQVELEEQKALEKKEKEEAAETERIRLENEKLKKEADEQAAKDKKIADKHAAEMAAQAKKQKEKQDAARAVHEEKMRKEVEAKKKLEGELKAKEDAERERKEEEERRKKDAENARLNAEKESRLAPDKKKLEDLAVAVTKIEMPTVSSEEAKAVVEGVVKLLNKTASYIKTNSINL